LEYEFGEMAFVDDWDLDWRRIRDEQQKMRSEKKEGERRRSITNDHLMRRGRSGSEIVMNNVPQYMVEKDTLRSALDQPSSRQKMKWIAHKAVMNTTQSNSKVISSSSSNDHLVRTRGDKIKYSVGPDYRKERYKNQEKMS